MATRPAPEAVLSRSGPNETETLRAQPVTLRLYPRYRLSQARERLGAAGDCAQLGGTSRRSQRSQVVTNSQLRVWRRQSSR